MEKSCRSDFLSVARVRLSEGFHFASSGDGIINMALELPIQVSLGAVLLWTPSLIAGSGVDSPSCDRICHLLLAHTLDTYREKVKQLVGSAFFCLHLQLESCFVVVVCCAGGVLGVGTGFLFPPLLMELGDGAVLCEGVLGRAHAVSPLQIDGSSESSSDREKHTCVVQYILFPPHSTSTKDR